MSDKEVDRVPSGAVKFSKEHQPTAEQREKTMEKRKKWFEMKKAERQIRGKVIRLFCQPLKSKETGAVVMEKPLEELVRFIQINIFNAPKDGKGLTLKQRLDYAFKFLTYASSMDISKDDDGGNVLTEERVEFVRRVFAESKAAFDRGGKSTPK